ncbi:cupin domain-containing protein [Gilvimarinus sp. F26214L]|uniref:cupin domain-containing protein n=1 Tax=Gilvimarinus sp. DZF01 TaxID=3461371 RepID=UPI0040468417
MIRSHSLAALLLCMVAESGFATAVDTLARQKLPSLQENREATMVTVEFEPGEASAPHRHNAHTFVYVLEGKLEFQVKGGELVELGTGDTFYESPEDVHVVARNTSNTEPARILVMFLHPAGAPTTVPVH